MPGDLRRHPTTELVADRVFKTHRSLELAVVEWVAWYNHHHLHERIGDIPPAEREELYYAAVAEPAA